MYTCKSIYCSTHRAGGLLSTLRIRLAHHSHNPTDRHWKADLKIMAYLHEIRGMRLTLVRGSGLDLTA